MSKLNLDKMRRDFEKNQLPRDLWKLVPAARWLMGEEAWAAAGAKKVVDGHGFVGMGLRTYPQTWKDVRWELEGV